MEKSLHEFLVSEKSVALIDLKCSACLLKDNCARCRHTNSPRSMAKLEETRLLDEAISCVSVAGKENVWMFELDYPELPDVDLSQKYLAGQSSNKAVAVQSSTSLRKKLDKEGYLEDFHEQIMSAVEKGEFMIVTENVKQLHESLPCSYQLVNYVHKTTSSSTKLRVISNSSISRVGGSLNENLAAGQNTMNLAIDVLCRWSCYGFAMLTDLSSAYRSVRTKMKTNSLRRFFWFRDPNDANSMIEIMVVRCNFGDKPAGKVLDLCNVRISDDPDISKPTSEFLKDGTYVDDGATSAQDRETIEQISRELGPLYQKYSFNLKYCLKSYLPDVDG